MDVEMARDRQYSLVVPYIAWAYQALKEFQETFRQVERIYDLGLSIGMAGMLYSPGP